MQIFLGLFTQWLKSLEPLGKEIEYIVIKYNRQISLEKVEAGALNCPLIRRLLNDDFIKILGLKKLF